MLREVSRHRTRPSRGTVLAFVAALLGATAAPAADLENLAIHGFLSQGYMGTERYDYLALSAEGSFQFSEMGINFSTEVGEDLRIGSQIFARDLGDLGNNQIELDWAYGDYAWRDEFGVRAGKIKLPFGLYNETRDVDALRTAVLLPQGIYDERLRDLLVGMTGVEFYGSTPHAPIGSLDWRTFWGTTNVASDGALAQFIAAAGPFSIDGFELQHSAGWAIGWNTPLRGLRFHSTLNHFDMAIRTRLDDFAFAQLAPMGAQVVETIRTKNSRLITSSVELTGTGWLLAAEHGLLLGRLENPFLASRYNRETWHALGSYRINEWLEAGTYYSVHWADRDDREGRERAIPHRGYQKDLTTSLRFDLNDYWLVKAEAHFIRGTASVLSTEDFDEGGENWTLITGKTSYIF